MSQPVGVKSSVASRPRMEVVDAAVVPHRAEDVDGHAGREPFGGGVLGEHLQVVRQLPPVVPEVDPAHAHDLLGVGEPARLEDAGEAVDEEVAGDPARVVPVVAPLVVARRAPGPLRGGSEPALPVEVGRFRQVRVHARPPGTPLLGVVADVVDLRPDDGAELAVADGLVGAGVAVVAHALDAHLHLPPGGLRLLQHGIGLADGVRHRLLAVHVQPGL